VKISDLRYGGVPAWPPAWTSSLPAARYLTGRLDALLRRVAVKGAGLEIEVFVEDTPVSGLLFWDGVPAPRDVKYALDGFLHQSVRQAGSAHIPQT
jgi:hypothetical protein